MTPTQPRTQRFQLPPSLTFSCAAHGMPATLTDFTRLPTPLPSHCQSPGGIVPLMPLIILLCIRPLFNTHILSHQQQHRRCFEVRTADDGPGVHLQGVLEVRGASLPADLPHESTTPAFYVVLPSSAGSQEVGGIEL